MKIFICCSKHIYSQIPPIKSILEQHGHTITLPNSYDNPQKELQMKEVGTEEYSKWKASMLRLQKDKISENDAILVLNMNKGDQKNYLGGATFLEVYIAFDQGKKVYFYNPIPEGILRDELFGMNPTVIYGNLDLISS